MASPSRQIYYYYKLKTYTFSSFNWIYGEFYPKKRKVIPNMIESYLTPLALAI